MKTYENGVLGPDLEHCDIVSYDFKDANVQFCLPKDLERRHGFLMSQEAFGDWKSISDVITFVKASWEYKARDEEGEWSVGSVAIEMELFNLDSLDFESWMEVEPYCLLKGDDLSRLAIEYFTKIVVNEARRIDPGISKEDALRGFWVTTKPEDLVLSKQDLLPWFTNRKKRKDGGVTWLCETFIPISERAVIFFQFDFVPLTYGERPFFFSEKEGQIFEQLLLEEFLRYFKVTYSPEIQTRIIELN